MSTKSSLGGLSGESKNQKTAPPSKQRSTIPSMVNSGSPSASADSSGIASPLTEKSRVTSNVSITDASGLISMTVAVATEITANDANSKEVKSIYVI